MARMKQMTQLNSGNGPSELQLIKEQIARLHDDAEGRTARHLALIAFESDFSPNGMMFPGGHESYLAYIEARLNFIDGNFISTILISQACIENLLASCIILEETSRQIHGLLAETDTAIPKRITLKWLIKRSLDWDIISDEDGGMVNQLSDIRNPLSHYRHMSDQTKLWRRSAKEDIPEKELLEKDAHLAISVVARIIPKISNSLGRRVMNQFKPNESEG
jgi:hypothetical protein